MILFLVKSLHYANDSLQTDLHTGTVYLFYVNGVTDSQKLGIIFNKNVFFVSEPRIF